MAAKKENTIELKPIAPKTITVTIQGDSDLILNKMNDPTARALTDARKDKAKSLEKPNEWECIATSVHWLKKFEGEYSEDNLKKNLENNNVCIPAFAFKKSFGDAVVRNEIDKYKTKFDASVNILGQGDNLIPVKFTEYYLDEKLMSPKKGAPVLVHLNRFSGWTADITISFVDNVYSTEQIINIINLAGFGLGIGSGRSSGYGRYHVVSVQG